MLSLVRGELKPEAVHLICGSAVGMVMQHGYEMSQGSLVSGVALHSSGNKCLSLSSIYNLCEKLPCLGSGAGTYM